MREVVPASLGGGCPGPPVPESVEPAGVDDRNGRISLEGVTIRGERIDIRVGDPPT